LALQDVELAADIIIGISLQVTRGTFNEDLRSICHARLSTLCFEPFAPFDFDIPRFQPSRGLN
jgi:hypothetical protein